MLSEVALQGCLRCGGPLRRSADDAERMRCLDCGWRNYADRLSRGGSGRFRIWLPHIGGRKDGARLKLLAADILGSERGGRLSLRVHCPLCPGSPKRMVCVNATRQYWHCPDGHSVRLKFRRGEYAGWL